MKTKPTQKQLLRRFHTLCSVAGITAENKAAIVAGFGVESSADIPAREMAALCDRLARQMSPTAVMMEKLRNRVMGSVGAYLRATGRADNAEVIKAIACRSTGYDNFNKIPAERLRNVYSLFANKCKDAEAAARIAAKLATETSPEPAPRPAARVIVMGMAANSPIN